MHMCPQLAIMLVSLPGSTPASIDLRIGGISLGGIALGRSNVTSGSAAVSREQLRVHYTVATGACTAACIGSGKSHIERASGERVKVRKGGAPIEVLPGDTIWLSLDGKDSLGGFRFEAPAAAAAPPAAPPAAAPPPPPPSEAFPAAAADSPAAPPENDAPETPGWQKSLMPADTSNGAGSSTPTAGSGGRGGRGGGRGFNQCYNCGEYGHIKRDCPQPQQGGKGRGGGGGDRSGVCFNCGESGHWAGECPKPRRPTGAAAEAAAQEAEAEKARKEAEEKRAEAAARRQAEGEARAKAAREAAEAGARQRRQEEEAMEAEARELLGTRALRVPWRELRSSGELRPADAAERVVCATLRLAAGVLSASAYTASARDGVQQWEGEPTPCRWEALPPTAEGLRGELYVEPYDITRHVLRLRAAPPAAPPAAGAGAGAASAGGAAWRELEVRMAPRRRKPPEAGGGGASASSEEPPRGDATVGGEMLRGLVALTARLRPLAQKMRARNDEKDGVLAARVAELGQQTEELRRIEDETLADFLPLLQSKRRRLSELEKEAVAKGVVVPDSSSSAGPSQSSQQVEALEGAGGAGSSSLAAPADRMIE